MPTRDYDGWEARLVDLSRDRTSRQRQARAAARRTGRASRATACSSAVTDAARRGSISSAWTPTPTSRRCCSRSCAARIDALRRAEGQERRARLPRSAARRARPRARQRGACATGFQRASSASSSTSSRTPIRCRRRSCCCSRPTIPGETDWRSATPAARHASSSSAIRSSRSTASAAPTSAIYREVCAPARGSAARRSCT